MYKVWEQKENVTKKRGAESGSPCCKVLCFPSITSKLLILCTEVARLWFSPSLFYVIGCLWQMSVNALHKDARIGTSCSRQYCRRGENLRGSCHLQQQQQPPVFVRGLIKMLLWTIVWRIPNRSQTRLTYSILSLCTSTSSILTYH